MSGKVIRRSLYGLVAVVVLLVAAEIAGMGYGYPPHAGFVAPIATARSWEQVFAAPGPIVLTSFETGRITVPPSGVLNMDDPATRGLSRAPFAVPVFAHWLHHPKFGDYLVDTGFDASFATGPYGNIHGVIKTLIFGASTQNPGEDLASQLQRHGVAPKGVFFTHLHPDHTAGVPSLPGDLQYVAGPRASYDNYPGLIYRDHLRGVKLIREFDFTSASAMPPLGPGIDVFGDGSLWAVLTPGHTRGHVSYVVNTTRGPVLLSGDASHTRWGFEHHVSPGWAENLPGAQTSLEQLIAFADRYPRVEVIYGHEYSRQASLRNGRGADASLVKAVAGQ